MLFFSFYLVYDFSHLNMLLNFLLDFYLRLFERPPVFVSETYRSYECCLGSYNYKLLGTSSELNVLCNRYLLENFLNSVLM